MGHPAPDDTYRGVPECFPKMRSRKFKKSSVRSLYRFGFFLLPLEQLSTCHFGCGFFNRLNYLKKSLQRRMAFYIQRIVPF